MCVPSVGLKRQDDGSAVKEWEDETEEFALQATVTDVASEDVRYVVRSIHSFSQSLAIADDILP